MFIVDVPADHTRDSLMLARRLLLHLTQVSLLVRSMSSIRSCQAGIAPVAKFKHTVKLARPMDLGCHLPFAWASVH